MSNKLKKETSPYLLQHAHNPVDWYPWCEEAFQKAETEDKPIFLSIGYSTCHWCHVMAHESFENKKTAEVLNKYFISVKVDREERPDIDSVYMSVCQAFTGSGGWPMSIFMTADKKPFFAGTYFPPYSHYGMPGFLDLINTVANQWNTNRSKLLQSADEIITHLKSTESNKRNICSENLIENAVKIFSENFDSVHGGFGSAPKFPTPHNLLFLTFYAKLYDDNSVLKMVEKTLTQMRKGGIFDHIGYGFSRYSTDKYFLAPHFEKMLYDNALLITAYTAVYSMTNNTFYLDTAKKAADYILREMTSPDGGFFSAQDADSEGVEGKFYTFTLSEILDVLGEEKGKEFAQAFDITAGGNFEGLNIPNLLKSNDLKSDFSIEIQKLYNYRKSRTKLHLDDKILLSWNALMIAALSMLFRASHDEQYLKAAKNAQNFIEKNLYDGTQLFASYRNGKHSANAFLDDYAFYTSALIELYNTTLDNRYIDKAQQICGETAKHFSDRKNGGFYLNKSEDNELFMNPKETYDGAIPSGNSVMAYNFARLYQLTENNKYLRLFESLFKFMSVHAQDYPAGHSMFLLAKLIHDNPPKHITVVSKNIADLQNIKKNVPFLANISIVPESKEHSLINGMTTYYVCENHSCLPPTNEYNF